MHRSGTTMLSKALDLAGIFQGVFRDMNNEAFHFLSMNQQMLERAGGSWVNPVVPSNEHWFTISKEQVFAEHFKIETLNPLKQRLLHATHWGWKDPRNTFTLDRWMALYPKARIIHVVRNGMDVALSLKHRNTVEGEVYSSQLNDLKFCFNLWEKYVEQGQKMVHKYNQSVEVKYESLLALKTEEVTLLNKIVGLDLSPHLEEVIQEGKQNVYPEELKVLADKSETFKSRY